MHTATTKIFDYVHADKTCHKYLPLALDRVFGALMDERGLNSLEELERFFGQDDFMQIYPVALEFFFSNRYENDASWNVIEHFMASPAGKDLDEQERHYLEVLKTSIMSVYEVVSIVPDQSITLRDLVRGGDPVTVKEKNLTHQVVQWDCLGLRVLDMGTHFQLAGACLMLDRPVAQACAESIQALHREVTKRLSGRGKAEDERLAQAMWAAEVATCWIETYYGAVDPTPSLFNTEGHPLCHVLITMPVTGDRTAIAQMFNAHSAFEQDSDDTWTWLKKARRSKTRGPSTTARGNAALCDDVLELYANSRQRANILEHLVRRKLGDLVGPATFHYDIDTDYVLQPPSEEGTATAAEAETDTALSPENMEQIMRETKDDYYHQWLGMSIPSLNGKTPRAAKRSKKGRAQVIALLKILENREEHYAQHHGIPVYDTSWLWKELDLDRNAA